MSAVSKRLTPASKQMSIRRVASATSVLPHALKNSLPPAKVATPKLRAGTLRPEPPSKRYSMPLWMRQVSPRCSLMAVGAYINLNGPAKRRPPGDFRDAAECPLPARPRPLAATIGKAAQQAYYLHEQAVRSITLRLFNTLSGQLDPLVPSDGEALRMYACGPTVYDYGHIGNFRTFLQVDVLRRFLKLTGVPV